MPAALLIFLYLLLTSHFILAQKTQPSQRSIVRDKKDTLSAEEKITRQYPTSITVDGYIDSYATYSTDSASTLNNRQELYSAVGPRTNQIGLNVARIGMAYSAYRVKANLGLFWGDIPASTLEPTFPMISDANVGIRIHNGLWLELGVFPTHIGSESLLPRDNLISSLAIATWHEPFFFTGAKLNWEVSDRIDIQLIGLNNYNTQVDVRQRMEKAVGLYVRFRPTEQTRFCFSNYLDNYPKRNSADSTGRRLFIYNNLHFGWDNGKFSLLLGGDFGAQENAELPSKEQKIGTAFIYNGLAIFKYYIKPAFSVALRYENFNNSDNFFQLKQDSKSPFQQVLRLNAGTLSLEYIPFERAYLRLEGRYLQLHKGEDIFTRQNGQKTNQRLTIMITIGASFASPNLFKVS
jgi:hypothetical protein